MNSLLWSPKHGLDSCLGCGRSEVRHWARGLCKSCYQRPYGRRAARRRYAADPEAYNEASRNWRRKNPYKWQALYANSRARVAGADGMVTAEQLAARLEYYGGKCYLCGRAADGIDHVIPMSRGGPNIAANIRPACRRCNSSKSRRLLAEYFDGISIPNAHIRRSRPTPPPANGRLTAEQKHLITQQLRSAATMSTQRQIADSLGIHESTVSLILNGKREPGRKLERAIEAGDMRRKGE